MSRKNLEMRAIGFMHGRTREEGLVHIIEQQKIDPSPDFWLEAEGHVRAVMRNG